MRNAYLAGLLSVLALGLLLAPARAEEKKGGSAKELIVGKWIPEEVEKGTDYTVEFTKDGKFIMKLTVDGMRFDFSGTYKFTAANKVETEVEFMGQKMKETLTVKVTKDELTTINERDKKAVLKRAK